VASTSDRNRTSAYVPLAAAAVLLGGAAVVWARFGAPAVVLWLAFAALAGAILLFWESLRAAIDPGAPGDEGEAGGPADPLAELDARKRAALRALKDLEFERSIHRLSDEDYAALSEKYRAEARAAMEAMDRGLGAYLARAEELFARAARCEVVGEDPEAEARPRKNRRKAQGASATATDAGVEAAVREAVTESAADESTAARRVCAACGTANDADAVFCKKCGARVGEAG
jgi:ribosomal protein L40E